MHDRLEKLSIKTTNWIGTPASLVVHTIGFVAIFGLEYFGWTFDQTLLVLTTAVSLEAIYLAIFIQMTVNRHAEQLAEVGEDVEDIQEEVEDLGEDVVEISEDIEKIQEEQTEDDTEDARTQAMLENIQSALHKLIAEVEALKGRPHGSGVTHVSPESLPSSPAAEFLPEPEKAEHEDSNYFRKFMGFISPKNKTPETTVVAPEENTHHE